MPTRRPAWFMICFALGLASCVALWALLPAEAQTPTGCGEWIANGGFEAPQTGWTFGAAPARPQRVNSIVHTGQWSLLLGIPQGYPNLHSYSSAEQQVSIPADATSAILSFWYQATMPGAPLTDYAELALLAPAGRAVIDKPWRAFVDNRVWNQVSFDLSGWSGQSVIVYFNVFNDGSGSTANMFLDDVSLQVCGSSAVTGTPTPSVTPTAPVTPTPTITPTPTATAGTVSGTWTPTPTATPTPTVTPTSTSAAQEGVPTSPIPTPLTALPVSPAISPPLTPPAPGCDDLVYDGGFESDVVYDGGYTLDRDHRWHTAPNKIPAFRENTNVFAGNYSMQLGTLNPASVASYSSVRQLVTIPAGYNQVIVQFATWTYAAPPGGSDRMEADFLVDDPVVLKKFWRVLLNEQYWVVREFDVTAYRGRSVLLYFNVYNDGAGGAAAMLLDEVHLWGCQAVVPIVPAATPGETLPSLQQLMAAQAAATNGPAATPVPGMTVLALSSNTPEPPRGPQAPTAGSAPVPTATPPTNLWTRIVQALRLPPLPPFWPWALAAILLVIGVLVFVVSRRKPRT